MTVKLVAHLETAWRECRAIYVRPPLTLGTRPCCGALAVADIATEPLTLMAKEGRGSGRGSRCHRLMRCCSSF